MTKPIPFTLHGAHIYAPVKLNGKNSHAFLDTGGRGCRISSAFADNLEISGETLSKSALGEQVTQLTEVSSIEFLGHRSENVRVDVAEGMSWQADHIPFDVSLSLGSTVLLAQPLMIDYCQTIIGFLATDPPENAQRLRGKFVHGLPIIEAEWNGQKIHAVFDTGAGMSVINAAKTNIFDLSVAPVWATQLGDAAGGSQQIDIYRCTQLAIAGNNVGESDYVCIDLTMVEQALEHPVDLILGTNTLLQHRRVWLFDKAQESIQMVDAPFVTATSER